MALDYDLVVIGSSRVGIYAAQNAVQLQARVALVTQTDDFFLPDNTLANYSLSEVGRFNYQLGNNPFTSTSERISPSVAQAWAKKTDLRIQAKNSLGKFSSFGGGCHCREGRVLSFTKLGFSD